MRPAARPTDWPVNAASPTSIPLTIRTSSPDREPWRLKSLSRFPEAEAVLVPVGGGGLLAGVATVLHALKPDLQIIGVELANAAGRFAAGLAAEPRCAWRRDSPFADGLAVVFAGRHTLAIAQPLVHRLVQVEEESLALAMLRLAELEKCIIEGVWAQPDWPPC